MPDTLAAKIRAKHPGAYDDMDDATLESAVTAKYPGVYDDMPRSTLPTKPVSAEDFMRPEDIANRDNGTSITGGILKGATKGLGRTVMGIGEMAAGSGLPLPGMSAARADPFNPVLRSPLFQRTDAALANRNDAEKVGGYMELAAELAPGAIGLVKAAPAIGRAAVSAEPYRQ